MTVRTYEQIKLAVTGIVAAAAIVWLTSWWLVTP